ncbi:MAG: hypothetical protein IJ587_11955 [Synergistaceae bacterium]|nr:hypothetical protein [Synergistaceae bacterium]
MSALRQATIVYNYAKKKNRLPLFRQLLEEADNEAEKLFLRSAVKDAQEGLEYYSDETEKIYDEKFPHDGPPCFPFYEVCGLPVLFKRGDVIRWHRKHGWRSQGDEQLYYVGGVPLLIPGLCDFSDEQYLSYPLSSPVKTEEDLGGVHEHINVCEAERASVKKLTPQQKCNYDKIKKILILMRLGRFYKGPELTLMKRLAARKNTLRRGN